MLGNSSAPELATSGVAPAREPEDGFGTVGRQRDETELERYDRNLTDLLGELRVALPGVQVLFAFLLVVPFNQRFGSVNGFERGLYLAALLLTLLASVLLVAPTIIHRLHFRLGDKAYVVRTANWLMITGLGTLAVAMTCAVLLVTSYLFDAAVASVTTALVVASFALVWFVLPVRSRHVRMRTRAPSGPTTSQDPSTCGSTPGSGPAISESAERRPHRRSGGA